MYDFARTRFLFSILLAACLCVGAVAPLLGQADPVWQLPAAGPGVEGPDDPAEDSGATTLSNDSKIDLDSIFSGKELPAAIHLKPMQAHFQKLIEKVRPATVGIEISAGVGAAAGSGVIVTRDGYVLTAAHVISQPDLDATIILQDGTRLKAKTLGMNHPIDSGMLKITEEGKWDYLDVGQSAELNVGQWVMAIGHPGGFDGERKPPIRVGRLLSVSGTRTLTTDCTLVGGDSGGPLVDMDGNVIGIHSRIGPYLNQNYHVAIDAFSSSWDDLIAKQVTGGRSPRPAAFMDLTFADDDLTIVRIGEDGPADKAGLQVGDRIIEFNGRKVRSQRTVIRELQKLNPDDTVDIVVVRDEQEVEVELTLTERPDDR